jgi:hypothetical protein
MGGGLVRVGTRRPTCRLRADQPITRSTATCTMRTTCADDTDHRTDGTHRAGNYLARRSTNRSTAEAPISRRPATVRNIAKSADPAWRTVSLASCRVGAAAPDEGGIHLGKVCGYPPRPKARAWRHPSEAPSAPGPDFRQPAVARGGEGERGPAGQAAEVPVHPELHHVVLDRVAQADFELVPDAEYLVQPPVRRPPVPCGVARRVGHVDAGPRRPRAAPGRRRSARAAVSPTAPGTAS